MTKALAYYLTQFHPVKRNDRWWGEGFTEWTNVKRARPLFDGHEQPRVPTELGYYDLTDPSVMAAQMQLASDHGLAGFCYYMYWFGKDRTILERPLLQMLRNKSLDFPFCLFWANMSWARTWQGRHSDVLEEQTYVAEEAEAYADYLALFFADDRYIRVNGAPVFVIYQPRALVDRPDFFAAVLAALKERGYPKLHLIVSMIPRMHVLRSYEPFKDAIGLDFSSHINNRYKQSRGGVIKIDYAEVVAAETATGPNRKFYRSVMTGFDESPRRGDRGFVMHGATADLYQKWLAAAYAATNAMFNEEERLLFIFAWNEWGESAYLEPDQLYGRSLLEATKRVLGTGSN